MKNIFMALGLLTLSPTLTVESGGPFVYVHCSLNTGPPYEYVQRFDTHKQSITVKNMGEHGKTHYCIVSWYKTLDKHTEEIGIHYER